MTRMCVAMDIVSIYTLFVKINYLTYNYNNDVCVRIAHVHVTDLARAPGRQQQRNIN